MAQWVRQRVFTTPPELDKPKGCRVRLRFDCTSGVRSLFVIVLLSTQFVAIDASAGVDGFIYAAYSAEGYADICGQEPRLLRIADVSAEMLRQTMAAAGEAARAPAERPFAVPVLQIRATRGPCVVLLETTSDLAAVDGFDPASQRLHVEPYTIYSDAHGMLVVEDDEGRVLRRLRPQHPYLVLGSTEDWIVLMDPTVTTQQESDGYLPEPLIRALFTRLQIRATPR